MPGILVLVSGLSGSGKSTLVGMVLERLPDSHRVVTCTTRSKRDGEVDGVHYKFLTVEQFEHAREVGAFVEWALVYENLYGTTFESIRQALACYSVVFLVTDVSGVATVKRRLTGTSSIFIEEDPEVAQRRIQERKHPAELRELERRTRSTTTEIRQSVFFDYRVRNVAGQPELATTEICRIVETKLHKNLTDT